jgi:Succinylglutamate desuccinylase / Aspartoacylase family
MQRLGKNIGSYFGDKIDIHAVLRDIHAAAQTHGWTSEVFYRTNEFELTALRRSPLSAAANRAAPRVYLSSGMHGDEPAGPLAVRQLLQENKWPPNLDLWFCPCLNPIGFTLNQRGNAKGIDLNREYLKPVAAEVVAHIAWFERQPRFDLCLLLHEDWESHGFYLYEQNLDQQPSLAETMVASVANVCPVDRSELIEGRPAANGIIRPNIDPNSRPDWPETFYLIKHKTHFSYTLEAPSDFPMSTRVAALVTGVNTALDTIAARGS